MATFITIDTRRQLENILAEAVASNPALREPLLQDPRGALEALGLTDLPEDLRVRIVEETDSEVTLVLPAAQASDELSDSELDAVAGGVSSIASSVRHGSLAKLSPSRLQGFAAAKLGSLVGGTAVNIGGPTGFKGPGGNPIA